MKNHKSLLTLFGEALDQYRSEQQNQHEPISISTQPNSRFRKILSWCMPNGGTIFLILILLLTQNVWAKSLNIPNIPSMGTTTINYQGRLADASGNPVPDDKYAMSFTIYDAPTGDNIIWGPEDYMDITVSKGLFSVGLGSKKSISPSTWSGDRYLQITVDGETLSPRELIRGVPIAGMALTVPDGAIQTSNIANGAITSEKLASNLCCGHTNPNGTGWVNYPEANGVYINVDTTSCHFSETPMYFTSLMGINSHWVATGVSSIYTPAATGFQIYLRSTVNETLTASKLDNLDWYIQWCGVKK